jgi:hypothetical protein
MALYINEGNQRILWSTIKSLPVFTRNIADEEKAIWFKEIIGYMYEKNKHRKLTNTQLQELNKDTISYMIRELQTIQHNRSHVESYSNSSLTGSLQSSNMNMLSKPNPFLEPSASHRMESKSESYSKQFLERQKEYEDMNRKIEPPRPVFQEQVEDGAIDNMEELVKQHLKQRELDIENIKQVNYDVPQKKSIKIVDDKIFIPTKPIDLPIEELSDNLQPRKSVRWNMENSNNNDNYDSGRQEIDNLKTTVNTLTDIIRNVQKELNELRKKVNEQYITNVVKNDIVSKVNYAHTIQHDGVAEPKNVSNQNNIEVISQII